MSVPKQFKYILVGLSVLALVSIVYKTNMLSNSGDTFHADEAYRVTYQYFFKTDTAATEVRAFLPKNNARQEIVGQKSVMPETVLFSTLAEGPNIRGRWSTDIKNA